MEYHSRVIWAGLVDLLSQPGPDLPSVHVVHEFCLPVAVTAELLQIFAVALGHQNWLHRQSGRKGGHSGICMDDIYIGLLFEGI